MSDCAPRNEVDANGRGQEPGDLEAVPVNAADVESAGRSCLVILGLGLVILLIILGWILVRSTAGGS